MYAAQPAIWQGMHETERYSAQGACLVGKADAAAQDEAAHEEHGDILGARLQGSRNAFEYHTRLHARMPAINALGKDDMRSCKAAARGMD